MAEQPYTTGWVDSSIHELLADLPALPNGMNFALITCLDSSLEPAKLLKSSDALKPLAKKAAIVGTGLLLPTRLLIQENAPRLFFGFDEVWFFENRDISPKPANLHLVGPHRAAAEQFTARNKWLMNNGCTLGLGDGAGLNFCARVRGIARLLLQAFQVPLATS